ncbi:MAG: hypothetical protein KDD02_19605 [Phaeodactylibacter sp.]|nr:hypothetical protein [Phaeodactylibacter sp.]MCB9300581.1 hypothetical protein [Lewinellaceae bacterium]
MAGTKNYFDQILENQNKLFSTLTNYTNAVIEAATPNKEAANKAGELLNEYFTRSYELVEKMAAKEHLEAYQKDFWSSFTNDYTKNMELSMDLYKKTLEYFRNIWAKDVIETQQDRVKKLTNLYQDSVKAIYETNTANAKVVEHYFE